MKSSSSSSNSSSSSRKRSFLIQDLLEIGNKSSALSTSSINTRQTAEEDEEAPNEVTLATTSCSRSRSRSRSRSPSQCSSTSDTSSCSNLKKSRKSRTAFSDYQLNSLERSFEKHKYLSVQDRVELAARLNLTDTQVIFQFIFYFFNFYSTHPIISITKRFVSFRLFVQVNS